LSQINTQKVLDSDTPNKSTHNFKKIDDLTKILDKGNE